MAQSATRPRVRRQPAPAKGSFDLEAVVGEIRALWGAVERVEPSRRPKLYEQIIEAIQRLKKRVQGQLPDPPSESVSAFPLFQSLIAGDEKPTAGEHEVDRFPEPILRLYDKDLADQALHVIPQSLRFAALEDFREHLAGTLPFNAESTRHRAANYLTGRYFPCGIIHGDLARFASVSEGRPWLGDVLFYLTCRVEKIVAMVAEEVVWPSLADGGVNRSRLTDYVRAQVPSWSQNSVKDVGAAIVRTYERFGLGSSTRTRLNVSVRRGDLPAFAYVLHLEFPEPGMHDFDRLLQGAMRWWLLWDPEWIVKQLYACEEAGLLTKISEIDRARQFTTKYTLDEAVGPIVSLI